MLTVSHRSDGLATPLDFKLHRYPMLLMFAGKPVFLKLLSTCLAPGRCLTIRALSNHSADIAITKIASEPVTRERSPRCQEWRIPELQTKRELAAGAERTGMLAEIDSAFLATGGIRHHPRTAGAMSIGCS
jgi:hypothetical protein